MTTSTESDELSKEASLQSQAIDALTQLIRLVTLDDSPIPYDEVVTQCQSLLGLHSTDASAATTASNAAMSKKQKKQLHQQRQQKNQQDRNKPLVEYLFVLEQDSSSSLSQAQEEKLQRIQSSLYELMIKCWLHQEQYLQVVEWVPKKIPKSILQSSSSSFFAALELYARYRLEAYSVIVAQLEQEQESTSNDATSTSSESEVTTILNQHLLAQSYFHESQTIRALELYKTLSSKETDPVQQLDLITNVFAVLVANATPYNASTEPSSLSLWLEKAVDKLSNSDHPEGLQDLAFNVGTYNTITGNTTSSGAKSLSSNGSNYWLEQALCICKNDGAGSNDKERMAIQTNLVWNRQWNGLQVDPSEYNKVFKSVENDSKTTTEMVASWNQALLSPSLIVQDSILNNPKKWNALHIRLHLYNQAVQQLQMETIKECQQSCKVLLGTLSNTKKSSKSKKGKSNKQGDDLASLYLPTVSQEEQLWWETRIDVLLAHACLVQDKEQQQKGDTVEVSSSKAISILQERMDTLKKVQPPAFVIDHAMTHAQLHLHYIQQNEKKTMASPAELITLLESLPKSIQSCQGVLATKLSLSLDAQSDGENAANESTKNGKDKRKEEPNLPESAFVADVLFSQGQYDSARNMYQKHLPPISSASIDTTQLCQQLRLLQTLVRATPSKGSNRNEQAKELWASLQPHLQKHQATIEPPSLEDAESLESMPLPLRKQPTTPSASGLVDESGKAAATTDDSATSNKQRSKDSIMRRRARKREAYLQSKGLVGTSIKPNPERWIPKYERSRRNQRGGRNQNYDASYAHRGAQGGTGGTSKHDLHMLDAAARAASGATNHSSNAPSTANLKVSSSGGGGGRKGGRRR